jgi:hypothetical protein
VKGEAHRLDKFSKKAENSFDKGAEYNIGAAKHITTRATSRFGKSAAPKAGEAVDTIRSFKLAKREQKPRQPENAAVKENEQPVLNDFTERAIHGKLNTTPTEGFAEGAVKTNTPKRFTAKRELLHTTEDRAEFIARKQQVFVAANSDKFKSSEPQKTPQSDKTQAFTDDKTKQFVYKGAKQKTDAVASKSKAEFAIMGVNAVISAGRQAANELREYQSGQDDAYAREIEDRAKQGVNFAFRSTQQVAKYAHKTAQNAAKAAQTTRFHYTLSKAPTTQMRFTATKMGFKKALNQQLAEDAAKVAVQNLQKAKIVKAVGTAAKAGGAAAAKAGTGAAVKAGAGAATGGVATLVLLGLDVLGSGGKKLGGAIVGEENKSSMNIVMLIGAFLLMAAPVVLIVMIIASALTPFSYFYELIDGIWTKKTAEYPAQAIQVYIDVQKDVIGDTNSLISGLMGGGGSGAANPMDTVDMEKWENGGSTAFMRWLTDEWIRSMNGEPPTEFDYTPYQKTYPTYMIDEHGNIITSDTDGTDIGGTEVSLNVVPVVAPKYMGAIWYGTTSDSGFEFNPDGKTDAERVPEDKYLEFLTTHCVDRAIKQTETDLMPNDFKSAYMGYNLWHFSVGQEMQHCEGCVGYTYWHEVEYEYEDSDGYTHKGTRIEQAYGVMCPGHIWDVLDLQLDSDPKETHPDEFFNVENVQKALWTYDETLDEDGDGTDDNGNTKKTLKEAQKVYKDTLKEITKMYEAAP